LVFDARVLTIGEAESLSLSAIDHWFEQAVKKAKK